MAVEVTRTIAEARAWRAARLCSPEGPQAVGFVPTMGFLHEGHLSLVRRARAESDWAVASIYVNPTQFGPQEDFRTYPRDLERDLQLLAAAGCDMAFVPSDSEMYPPGFDTWVEVGAVARPLEGAHRRGHFRGVATVVLKLFEIVQPTRAYFGEKDAQQLVVIQRLVADLNLPVTIVPCPTVREPDGLAMSSRNTYLSAEERQAATVLYRALAAAQAAFAAGERSAECLRAAMRQVLAAEPLARVDYVSVADPETLAELDQVASAALCSLAVRIGRTRLIDNLRLGEPASQGQPGSAQPKAATPLG